MPEFTPEQSERLQLSLRKRTEMPTEAMLHKLASLMYNDALTLAEQVQAFEFLCNQGITRWNVLSMIKDLKMKIDIRADF